MRVNIPPSLIKIFAVFNRKISIFIKRRLQLRISGIQNLGVMEQANSSCTHDVHVKLLNA